MKKTLGGILLSLVLVLSISINVFGATCLDVRDYGYHRYNQRYIDICEEERSEVYRDASVIRYTVTVRRIYICVCGAQMVDFYSYLDEVKR